VECVDDRMCLWLSTASPQRCEKQCFYRDAHDTAATCNADPQCLWDSTKSQCRNKCDWHTSKGECEEDKLCQWDTTTNKCGDGCPLKYTTEATCAGDTKNCMWDPMNKLQASVRNRLHAARWGGAMHQRPHVFVERL